MYDSFLQFDPVAEEEMLNAAIPASGFSSAVSLYPLLSIWTGSSPFVAKKPPAIYVMPPIVTFDVSSHVVEVVVCVTGGHKVEIADEMAADSEDDVKVPTGTGEDPI